MAGSQTLGMKIYLRVAITCLYDVIAPQQRLHQACRMGGHAADLKFPSPTWGAGYLAWPHECLFQLRWLSCWAQPWSEHCWMFVSSLGGVVPVKQQYFAPEPLRAGLQKAIR